METKQLLPNPLPLVRQEAKLAILDSDEAGKRLVKSASGQGEEGVLTVSCWAFSQDMNSILVVNHPTFGWVPPGGHVHQDEAPALAASRELREETGVCSIPNPTPAAVLASTMKSGQTLFCLAYAFVVDQTVSLQAEGNQDVKWIAVEDIPTAYFPRDKERILAYKAIV